MTQHALEQRGCKNRNVTSVFEDVIKDVYLLFPPTMAGRPEESDGQVHPICGHSVTTPRDGTPRTTTRVTVQ